MPESKTFSIRSMQPGDLDQAFGLSIDEGWNQTATDWRLLFDDPGNICLVAEKDNRVVGTATALNHDNKIAWIGMVLVNRSLRGQGAGMLLLEEIIERLKHIESVKLDATPAGEPLYRKLGFVTEYKILRLTRNPRKYQPVITSPDRVSAMSLADLSEINRFDSTVFGADRSYLLNHLFKYYPEKAFCLRVDDRIEGAVFGRAGSKFNYIGPVSAMSSESAIKLVSRSLELLNDQAIALDVPEDKAELLTWLESEGFIIQRDFARMYLRVNPYPGIVNNQFLISGPEFG